MEKISLLGLDIVIPFRGSSDEREVNLYAVLGHIALTYKDYRILLTEADEQPRFNWARLADPNVWHCFIPSSRPFPKALLNNLGARLGRGPVLCFHDADCIAEPQHFKHCVTVLREGADSDALSPFQAVVNVAGALKRAFLAEPKFDHFIDICRGARTQDATDLYIRANGGIFLIRRRDYIRVGGCNPAIEGWGSEDNEFYFRSTRLGVRWHIFAVPLMHLHHDAQTRFGIRGKEQSSRNRDHETASREMPLAELEALAASLRRTLV